MLVAIARGERRCRGATSLVPALAADKKEEQQRQKDLAKPLKAAQEALQAKKYPDALAKIKEAEAIPKKTPYDQHVINDARRLGVRRREQLSPRRPRPARRRLNDGFIDAGGGAAASSRRRAQINYQLKNYDKAIEFGNRAIKGGFADEDIKIIVGAVLLPEGRLEGHPEVRRAARRR